MTALFTADRNRLVRAAAALVGVAVALGGCNTDRALIASIPEDYRLRHPIAIQEANQSVVIFVGQARGGLSASQRADVMGLAQTWLREGTGAISADLPGGRRAAARDRCPPLSSGRPANIRDDPPELSQNLGHCRSLRPVAGGCRTFDQQQELFRKQVLLQFRLRLPAQHGRNDRQSVGSRAAAVRDARLYDAAHGRFRKVSQRQSDHDHLSRRRQGQTQRYRQMNSYARKNPEEQPGVTPTPEDDHIAPAPRVSVQAFCETAETAAAVQSAAEDRRLGKAHLRVEMGGMAAAIEDYHTAPTPNVIILETEGRGDILGGLDHLATVCDSGTRVVVIGNVNDVTLYRELVRRGVSDYVIGPVDALDVVRSICGLYSALEAKAVGRIVAIVGAKGGVGASTVAHNVAWAIARDVGLDSVVADLDLAFGTAGLDYNQDPS